MSTPNRYERFSRELNSINKKTKFLDGDFSAALFFGTSLMAYREVCHKGDERFTAASFMELFAPYAQGMKEVPFVGEEFHRDLSNLIDSFYGEMFKE